MSETNRGRRGCDMMGKVARTGKGRPWEAFDGTVYTVRSGRLKR